MLFGTLFSFKKLILNIFKMFQIKSHTEKLVDRSKDYITRSKSTQLDKQPQASCVASHWILYFRHQIYFMCISTTKSKYSRKIPKQRNSAMDFFITCALACICSSSSPNTWQILCPLPHIIIYPHMYLLTHVFEARFYI